MMRIPKPNEGLWKLTAYYSHGLDGDLIGITSELFNKNPNPVTLSNSVYKIQKKHDLLYKEDNTKIRIAKAFTRNQKRLYKVQMKILNEDLNEENLKYIIKKVDDIQEMMRQYNKSYPVELIKAYNDIEISAKLLEYRENFFDEEE